MTIPDYQTLMLPVLQLAGDRPTMAHSSRSGNHGAIGTEI